MKADAVVWRMGSNRRAVGGANVIDRARRGSAGLARITAAFVLGALGLAALPAAKAQTITVAAAASAGDAVRELGPLFESTFPGQRVQVTTGASGALIQQASRGAPIDVLITADAASMDQAEAKGLLAPSSRRALATNTLVLVQPASAAPLLGSLEDLAGPKVGRIGMGQPDSVPAGRLAQLALEEAKVWPKVKPRVINALTVRQVLDYVSRGEVDAGFVYATDAQKAGTKVRVAFKVPGPPVVVSIAPMSGSLRSDIAARFVEFVQTPRAQAALKRHGFGAP